MITKLTSALQLPKQTHPSWRPCIKVKMRILIQDVIKAMSDELVGVALARSTGDKTHVHECPDCEPLDGAIAKILA